jgi:hypothetical protein
VCIRGGQVVAIRTYGAESIFVHRIAFEEVWRVNFEAVASKVVGKKLSSIEQKNEQDTRTGQDMLTREFSSSIPKTSVRNRMALSFG